MPSVRTRRFLAGPALALAALSAAYVALAAAYGATIPLWEAPDAIWHYHFAAHLAAWGGLPTRADEGVTAPWRQEGSQPPLYYLAAAPLIALVRPTDAAEAIRYNPHANVGVPGVGDNLNRMLHTTRLNWPWRGTALAARLVGLSGILWGLLAVLATWSLARAVLPARPAVAVAAAALLAFNPQFVFLSGAITNDVAVAATAALALWAMAALLRHGRQPWRLVALGLALGLAALAKLSGLWLLPLAGMVVVVSPPAGDVRPDHGKTVVKAGTGGRRPLLDALLVAAPALAVGGWWYARNWLLVGDPTGLPLMLSAMTPRPAPPGLRELASEAVGVWKSYWAVFGWFNVIAPGWVYGLTTAITVAGLAGLAWAALRRRLPREAWRGLALAAVWLLTMVGALYLWARLRYPQGRLLLPAAPALALLVGAGWVLPWPERAGRWAAGGLAVCLAALTAWLLPAVVLPAYAAPGATAGGASAGGRSWSVALPTWWTARSPGGEGFAVAHEVAVDAPPGSTLRTGQPLTVRITWLGFRKDRDWSVYLHLVDDDGVVVAQRDSFPGGGARPTSDWRLGNVVTDTHRLVMPFTAGSPASEPCHLRLGLYDVATGQRASFRAHGHQIGGRSELAVADYTVLPETDELGHAAFAEPVHFGDDIVLTGYDLHRRALDAGEKLAVTLYWRALRPPGRDYRVSVQLRDGDRAVAQSDAAPAREAQPTRAWAAGEVVADRHSFRVPRDVPPGDYRLRVALYPPGGRPVPVQFRDFDHDLGPVRVTEGKR